MNGKQCECGRNFSYAPDAKVEWVGGLAYLGPIIWNEELCWCEGRKIDMSEFNLTDEAKYNTKINPDYFSTIKIVNL